MTEQPIGHFNWSDLGNIEQGRPNLGHTTNVIVYRLMQYTLRSALIARYDLATANGVLYDAGKMAGAEFCTNLLDNSLEFSGFIAELQEKLRVLNMGIIRMEKADLENNELVLTLSEDLDCSGLPVGGEAVCSYDEGFLAGVLKTYTGRDFTVKEIDCWATGEKTCRFRATVED